MEDETFKGHDNIVFESKRLPAGPRPREFAPFQTVHEDDECVNPVPTSQPCLLSISSAFNTRPFVVDGIVRKAISNVLVDSGSSGSFVSTDWCKRHNITPKPLNSFGRLANNQPFSISGQLSNIPVKLGGFRTKWTFLVSDLPGLDVVIGLDFLHHFDP